MEPAVVTGVQREVVIIGVDMETCTRLGHMLVPLDRTL